RAGPHRAPSPPGRDAGLRDGRPVHRQPPPRACRPAGGGHRSACRVTLPEIGDGLPEVVVRTAIVYLFLVVAMRLSGKRQVGQMSILELIIVLVVADAVQNSMVGQ